MDSRILVTIGPGSLNKDVIKSIENEDIYLFRINMSHTSVDTIEHTISQIQRFTSVPICIDSEGAQIRNQSMKEPITKYTKSSIVKIHFEEIIGDSENISFHPSYVAHQLQLGDCISVDFNSVIFKVIEKTAKYCYAEVLTGGSVGSNKAANLDREIKLEPITFKDKRAIEIAREMGIKNFALSFANSKEDLVEMRKLVGGNSSIC